jgi:predicted RNA-binding Zn ribbon-like protein
MAPDSTLPPPASLVLSAANSIDIEAGTDQWGAPADLVGWLHEHAGGPASGRLSVHEFEDARLLRDRLRALIEDGDGTGFDAAARAFPLRVELVDGRPALSPVADGAVGAISRIVAAAASTALDGSWDHIKLCAADDCRWAFYDESRNHSRTWCSMRVCGNRTKTRLYRSRHQPA